MESIAKIEKTPTVTIAALVTTPAVVRIPRGLTRRPVQHRGVTACARDAAPGR
jgi:hypothetical protein